MVAVSDETVPICLRLLAQIRLEHSMNRYSTENLDTSVEFSLRAKGSDDAQLLVIVASLGMCQALASGAISPDQACQRLFGPALLTRLEKMRACPSLQRAIHLATEIEDVADIIPDRLARAIADVEAELMKALAMLDMSKPAEEKWLVRAP